MQLYPRINSEKNPYEYMLLNTCFCAFLCVFFIWSLCSLSDVFVFLSSFCGQRKKVVFGHVGDRWP